MSNEAKEAAVLRAVRTAYPRTIDPREIRHECRIGRDGLERVLLKLHGRGDVDRIRGRWIARPPAETCPDGSPG